MGFIIFLFIWFPWFVVSGVGGVIVVVVVLIVISVSMSISCCCSNKNSRSLFMNSRRREEIWLRKNND